jgi:chromosome partitioning protein
MWIDIDRKAPGERSSAAHVIVFGNEKGGSGKSTTAIHIAVALLKAGQRVATVDLDSRQRTLTRFVENRRAHALRVQRALEVPTHYCVARGEGVKVDENEAAEFSGFAAAIGQVQQTHDFVVIDTPGTDSYLTRLAHSMADTLVTPVNDSFLDFDVLGLIDAQEMALAGPSHYAELVREARRQRRSVDAGAIDWIVMLNRWSPLADGKSELVGPLKELACRFGFWIADGLAERRIYRELFPRGLTALDEIECALLGEAVSDQDRARQEIELLLPTLMLPVNERASQHAAARAEWFARAGQPLDLEDVFAPDAPPLAAE